MDITFPILCYLLTTIIINLKISSAIDIDYPVRSYIPDFDNHGRPHIFPKIGINDIKNDLKSFKNKLHEYLPATTFPLSYLIKMRYILESDFAGEEELTAPGTVSILVKCVAPTKDIVMHANVQYLRILENATTVTETLLGLPLLNNQIHVVNQTFDVDNDFYTIHLGSACKTSREYIVNISFVADIAIETLRGLYLSNYTDPVTNITKRLVATQFEAEWARRMFPHYDDPDYKSTFQIIIGRHERYNSMSNMNLIKTELNNELPGWAWDHYAPTPKMSSYLLALVVSDFTCVNATVPYRKQVEVCGPPHVIENGGGIHSANVAATILEYYDRFMKQAYPLPKMTSVIVPIFIDGGGAMENWGLNTYLNKGLIYYPGITSEERRLDTDLTIAHELAHQNFGNLVTCKYWNQIWLNEGFATYISYFGLQAISPEYGPLDTLWFSGYRREALLEDGSPDTHPLVNISDSKFYFDTISYEKGASLLKMLENILSPRIFHEGLQIYLAKHAFNTATQWDLFAVLDRVANVGGVLPPVASITEFMENWSLQSGYPLLRVEYLHSKVIRVTQERFFDSPPGNDSQVVVNKPVKHWHIPITLLHNKSPISPQMTPNVPKIWLSNLESMKVIYLEDDFDWIVVNHDGTMFGRVLYDTELANRILNQLNTAHLSLTEIARAQIIDDAFETAWAGYGRIETALDFTKYLSKEHEPVVWSAALDGLGKIYSMFAEEEENLKLIKDYIQSRISASLELVGMEQGLNEKGMKVLHRGTLHQWAGVLELPKALNYAKSLVARWVDSNVNWIPSDLHSPVFCNAIIGSDQNMIVVIKDLIQKEKEIDVQNALARSLACSKEVNILNELRYNLTSDDLNSKLSYELLMKLSRNVESRKTLVKYLDENFYELKEYFKLKGEKLFVRSLELAAQYWNTEAYLEQVENFLAKYRDELSDFHVQNRLKRVVDQIRKNILWKTTFTTPIIGWLTSNK